MRYRSQVRSLSDIDLHRVYSTPSRIILSNAAIDDGMNTHERRTVAIEPANAMRIYHSRNAKIVLLLKDSGYKMIEYMRKSSQIFDSHI